MRRITVTVKALTLSASGKCLPWHTRPVTEEGGVAPEAVFLNHFLPGLPDVNGVRFAAKSEDGRSVAYRRWP